jgi:hypothetical protein
MASQPAQVAGKIRIAVRDESVAARRAQIETSPVGDTETSREQSMRLQVWNETIQAIVGECRSESLEKDRNKILLRWRAKLEKEPAILKPFQIDMIIREVRRRLKIVSR